MLSRTAKWRKTIGCRSSDPHKGAVPLFAIPGLTTSSIESDAMHTFNLGWGVDLAASSVVGLCLLDEWGAGALDRRLDRAYGCFLRHTTSVGKTTSIDRFSKITFDMKLSRPSNLLIGPARIKTVAT